MNTNCLKGFACPQCEADGPFKITSTTVATMYDDGCGETSHMEWDDASPCVCNACGHTATVAAFRLPDAL